MRINIEASSYELAEIIANGMNIGDLPEAIIVAIDDCLSLPGYNVTVNEPSAIQAQLVAALSKSKRYVSGAYECAFPDEEENAQVLIDIDAALAAAGEQP